MKPFRLFSITITLFVLTACHDDEKIAPLSAQFFSESPQLFLHSTPDCIISENVKVSAIYDDDYRTADLWINNLNLNDGYGRNDLSFRNLAWDFVIGTPTTQRAIISDALTADSLSTRPLTLTGFRYIYCHANDMDAKDCHGILLDFDYGGQHFTAYPYRLYCEGTTVIQSPQRRAIEYTPSFVIEFTPAAHLAAVTISGIDFDSDNQVEPIPVRLDNVSATFSPGAYDLALSAPVAVNDSVTVTSLTASARLNDELEISTTIERSGHVYRLTSHLKPNFFDTPALETVD